MECRRRFAVARKRDFAFRAGTARWPWLDGKQLQILASCHFIEPDDNVIVLGK